MTSEDFPAQYRSADDSSADAQRTYPWLIRLQYGSGHRLRLWTMAEPYSRLRACHCGLERVADLSVRQEAGSRLVQLPRACGIDENVGVALYDAR